MAYVKIPKDLSDVETKIVMGLTKRQLCCFAVGAVIGFPLFFLLRQINNTLAGIALVGATIPAFAFAIYKKNGMPLEKYIRIVFRFFISKKKRPYVTENYYADLTRYQDYYEEVDRIVSKKGVPE
ncbi:MAG: PrgI family protein [Clostridia bacterium]|nr:PrgI family protein [Clostridia bacterium]